MTPDAVERRDRRLALALFALLLGSYAFYFQGGGWNENSRLDLSRALVEHATFSIDAYHTNTGDKALFRGHYYSDKAPGVSLLGAPAYALVRLFRPLFSSEHDFVVMASHTVTILTVGMCSALLGVLLFRMARLLGAAPAGAVIMAVGYGLGTIAFPLSTMLFSHQVAALCLFAAFYFARLCKHEYTAMRSAAVGLCAAAAVLVEFPSAIAIPIIASYHLDLSAGRRGRMLVFGAGVGLPALLLAAYLWTTFGSPVTVGYDVLSDPGARAEMQGRGLFGITYPKIHVMVELLIGRFRGLIPYSPLLLPAAAGFFIDKHRRERLTCLGVIVVYLLFVSSYEWWQGGASFSSRHLAPMLPFWTLPLCWVVAVRPRLTVAAVAFSVFCMTVVTTVQPKPGEHYRDPFWGTLLPRFVRGVFAANNLCAYTGRADTRDHVPLVRHARHDAYNLGMLLGTRGHGSLIPLAGLWLVSGWVLRRQVRGSDATVEEHTAENEPA